MMTYSSLRRLRLTLFVTATAAMIGSILANLQSGKLSPTSTLGGAVDGLLIGFALAVWQLYVHRAVVERMNFSVALLVNSAVYTCLIVMMRTTGRILVGHYESPLGVADDPLLIQTTVVVLLFSLFVNLAFQISDVIGARELWYMITGRYHHPRVEVRIFMFIDLVGSTSMAEKLGPQIFLRLLDSVYRDMTEPILRTRAEIYKYVGDEIILSWTLNRASALCLDFLRHFGDELKRRSAFYEREFGVMPKFRAALHGGTVATGEMGTLKKEIVYLGDVLNVTARILEECRKLDRPFVCSEEAIALLGLPPSFGQRLGIVELRGREAPMGLMTPILDEHTPILPSKTQSP